MNIAVIFDIVDKLLGICVSQIPSFDVRLVQKINSLRDMYAEEMGKDIDAIDAGKLDSIELELRNQLQLLSVAVSGSNNTSKP